MARAISANFRPNRAAIFYGSPLPRTLSPLATKVETKVSPGFAFLLGTNSPLGDYHLLRFPQEQKKNIIVKDFVGSCKLQNLNSLSVLLVSLLCPLKRESDEGWSCSAVSHVGVVPVGHLLSSSAPSTNLNTSQIRIRKLSAFEFGALLGALRMRTSEERLGERQPQVRLDLRGCLLRLRLRQEGEDEQAGAGVPLLPARDAADDDAAAVCAAKAEDAGGGEVEAEARSEQARVSRLLCRPWM